MNNLKQLVEQEMDRAGTPAFGLGDVQTRRDRKRRNQRIGAGLIGIAIAVAVAWFGVALSGSPHNVPADHSSPSPTDESVQPPLRTPNLAQSDWSPVVERSSVVDGRRYVDGDSRLNDPAGDTSLAWLDITHVVYGTTNAGNWNFGLSADPPRGVNLEPGRIISYGLVLDTDGDGAADFLVGLNNDAPKKGEFHTWVTDLATGTTDESFGPPYGFPVEFAHPDEAGTSGGVLLTFLKAPHGMDPRTVRFYAWAAETQGPDVVASDFAPDTGWMSLK